MQNHISVKFMFMERSQEDHSTGLLKKVYSLVGAMQYGDCVVIVNSIKSITNTLTNASDMLLNFQKTAMDIDN